MNAAPGSGSVMAAAIAQLHASAAATTELQIELCELPAPVGGEAARAETVAQWLRTAGCAVDRDGAGNVIARIAGRGDGPAIAIAAHLDTVFAADQPVRVIRAGEPSPYSDGALVPAGEIHAPGIADDAAGLAALIALAQAMTLSGIEPVCDLLLVATVGEEGHGDLRGARQFFAGPPGSELAAFITIDHPDPNVVVHRGVGSRRYAVTFHGPGGHSWGDFGRYNPAQAMAAAARRIGAIRVSDGSDGGPRTTYNIGVMRADGSVNAIPKSAQMEIDLRSEDGAALDALEAEALHAIEAGHAEERKRRPDPAARVEIAAIGDRPAGETPITAPLIRAAVQALEAEGFSPQLTASSTDANAAMAAGVPAICLGWGGRSGNQHSLREYFAPEGRERTLAALLWLITELTGIS